MSAGAALAGGPAVLKAARPAHGAQIDASGRAWLRSYSGPDAGPGLPPGQPGKDYQPVVTPNNVSLPWKIKGGVKVYVWRVDPSRRRRRARCSRSRSLPTVPRSSRS
jgi:manganese oxidase